VWCCLWGTDWILKYYLDELRLQRVNENFRTLCIRRWDEKPKQRHRRATQPWQIHQNRQGFGTSGWSVENITTSLRIFHSDLRREEWLVADSYSVGQVKRNRASRKLFSSINQWAEKHTKTWHTSVSTITLNARGELQSVYMHDKVSAGNTRPWTAGITATNV
jgi:hypothetical protein